MAASSTTKTKSLTGEEVREIFASIDANGDGQVSPTEFGMLLARLGVALSEEKRAALFEEADKDGSGAIDVDELAAFLESTPVESETTMSARAVRAGLVAQFYASVFEKTLAGTSAAAGSAMHQGDVKLAVGDGCKPEEAASIVAIVANHDASRLDASLEGKEAAVCFKVGMVAGVDREQVAAFFAAMHEETDISADLQWGDEADGQVALKVTVDLPEGAPGMDKLEPIREMSEGVELRLRVLSKASLKALLDQETPAIRAGVSLEVTGTASVNLVSTLSSILPGGGMLGAITPTVFSLSTGISASQLLGTMGMDDPSDEDLLEMQAGFKLFKGLRKMREALADGDLEDGAPPGALHTICALRSIRGADILFKGAAVSAEISGGDFRIEKE